MTGRQLLRDRLGIAALVLVGILIAAPGVHLFELWMPHPRAFVISHGLALCILAVAVQRWRAQRARHDASPSR